MSRNQCKDPGSEGPLALGLVEVGFRLLSGGSRVGVVRRVSDWYRVGLGLLSGRFRVALL